jgi:hypothetical protein
MGTKYRHNILGAPEVDADTLTPFQKKLSVASKLSTLGMTIRPFVARTATGTQTSAGYIDAQGLRYEYLHHGLAKRWTLAEVTRC